MSGSQSDDGFNKERADLFEALGHPLRLEIMRALSESPLGFADLKRKVNVTSSGHLTHHLEKLDGLVMTTPDGLYGLSDDGREALRVVGRLETIGQAAPDEGLRNHRVMSDRRLRSASLVASALLVALGSFLVVFGASAYYCPIFSPASCSRTFYFVTPFQLPTFSPVTYYFNYTMNAVGLVMLCAGLLSLLRERRASNPQAGPARTAYP